MIHAGHAETAVGSVDICNVRENIAGVEEMPKKLTQWLSFSAFAGSTVVEDKVITGSNHIYSSRQVTVDITESVIAGPDITVGLFFYILIR